MKPIGLSLAFSFRTLYESPMLWRYVIMILILLGIGWAFYPSTPVQTPTALPDIQFTLPDGKDSSLQQYKGRTVLVHFWASWCPPCLPEMPELVKLAQQHPDTLTVIAFSQDQTPGDMKRFLESKFKALPDNFIALFDTRGQMARDTFYSFTYPETYIIGCDGRLRDKVIGVASDWEREIEPHLAACQTPAETP